MLITIFKENGHDNVYNGIIDCEDNCKYDFSDIRFIDQTNTTLLPYWIEEIGLDNGDHYSRIWVKTTGENTIFMYYGNPNAISLSNGTSTFVFFDDFDLYTEGEQNPGDWYIKTCSFETGCSVISDKIHAYNGKCLDVMGTDIISNQPHDQYSVANRTINLDFGTYELRTYMKAYYSFSDLYGYVKRDGTILITKNNWNTYLLGTAIFIASITDLELVTQFNNLYDADYVSVYYDNLLIRKYNFPEPYWAYFNKQYKWSTPPTIPTITGPPSGNTNNAYPYTFISTDLDGDDLSYYIEWGDGKTTIWTEPRPSGAPGYIESHTWNAKGTYFIQAKAKDVNDFESNWATLEVQMPRDYTLFISRPFEKYYNVFILLKHLLRLQI